jgi:hypothetical protein
MTNKMKLKGGWSALILDSQNGNLDVAELIEKALVNQSV